MELGGLTEVRTFAKRHPQARRPLEDWVKKVEHAHWNSLVDLKATFPSADLVSRGLVVFNVSGNKYRLVADVDFGKQQVRVIFVLTHRDYDRLKL